VIAGGVAADGEAGKNKAEACAPCHGEKGISPTGLTQKRVVEPVTISGTAVVGLIGYPLLQPAWVMVK